MKLYIAYGKHENTTVKMAAFSQPATIIYTPHITEKQTELLRFWH